MIGWLFLLTPLAIVGYAAVRLVPIYLNYMSVEKALNQVESEIPNESATTDAILRSLYAHFQVNSIEFPDVKDLKIAHTDGVWTIQANYDDQAPLFKNVFILVNFDKTVTLKGGGSGT